MRGGGRRGGAAHTAASQRRERAGTEQPWHLRLGSLGSAEPRLGGSASTKLLTTLTVNVGEQGIKSAPDLRQES